MQTAVLAAPGNPGGYCNHGFCQVAYDADAHGQSPARVELPTE